MYGLVYKGGIDNKIEVVENYVFGNHAVPQGYRSDGLTIFLLFRLFVNKFSPKYLPCAVMHDYLTDKAFTAYVSGRYFIAGKRFKEADDLFEEMLTIADSGKLSPRSKLMVYSVRTYHDFKYCNK